VQPDCIWIFIETRKNDQYREGHRVPLAKWPGNPACPVSLVNRLLSKIKHFEPLAGSKAQPTRPLFSFPISDHVYGRTRLEYARCLDALKKMLLAIGIDPSKYSTHSLRSGGASQAVAAGIPLQEVMRHGGWKSSQAALGYIQPTIESRLDITRIMQHAIGTSLPALQLPARPQRSLRRPQRPNCPAGPTLDASASVAQAMPPPASGPAVPELSMDLRPRKRNAESQILLTNPDTSSRGRNATGQGSLIFNFLCWKPPLCQNEEERKLEACFASRGFLTDDCP
jgi:hypothetical protein